MPFEALTIFLFNPCFDSHHSQSDENKQQECQYNQQVEPHRSSMRVQHIMSSKTKAEAIKGYEYKVSTGVIRQSVQALDNIFQLFLLRKKQGMNLFRSTP